MRFDIALAYYSVGMNLALTVLGPDPAIDESAVVADLIASILNGLLSSPVASRRGHFVRLSRSEGLIPSGNVEE
jgi:hypothetical protein